MLWFSSLLLVAVGIILDRSASKLSLQTVVSGGHFLGQWAKNPMDGVIHWLIFK
jgi:hypothetical protein